VNAEIIELEDKKLEDDFKKFFGVETLTSKDFDKISGPIYITGDEEKGENDISQNDLDILLKYVNCLRCSNVVFRNIVFRGNTRNKISFENCTFLNCECENAVILTTFNDECYKGLSSIKNSKIEIELSSLDDLQYAVSQQREETTYSFKHENEENKLNMPIPQSYSLKEINELNEKFNMIRKMVPKSISSLDKILIVSILLCEYIMYDYRGVPGSEEAQRLSEEEQELYNSLCHAFKGSLLRGIAVCYQYAVCLNWGLEAIGIKSKVITSENHVWNQIELDGKWDNYDLTNLSTYFRCLLHFNNQIFLTSNETIANQNNVCDYKPNSSYENSDVDYEYDINMIEDHVRIIKRVYLSQKIYNGWKLESTSKDHSREIHDLLEKKLSER